MKKRSAMYAGRFLMPVRRENGEKRLCSGTALEVVYTSITTGVCRTWGRYTSVMSRVAMRR